MSNTYFNVNECTSWECSKGKFSNQGERPLLSTNIEITSEMKESYNASKKRILKRNVIVSIATSAFLFFSAFRLDGIGVFFVAFLVFCMAIVAVKQFLEKEEVEEEFIENCIKPLAKQILPEMKIVRDIEVFPLYGASSIAGDKQVEDDKFQSYRILRIFARLKLSTKNHTHLGHFLEQRCVVPKFNSGFATDFVLDTLTDNKEGFLFTNAHATSKDRDGDGHSSTITEFKGPVVVMRISHAVRSGVGLYATKTSSILKREKQNGYIKVNTINTENEEFNRNFEVMAKEESQAFFVLSPLVMDKLMALKKKYGNFGMYIEEDYIVFGFNINRKMLAMPEKVGDAKRMSIEKTAEELVEMLRMIYEFKDAVDLNFDTQLA